MSNTAIQVTLIQQQDYRFDIHFGGEVPVLTGDEPAPLGTGQGPRQCNCCARPWATACRTRCCLPLRKFKQAPEPIRCEVTADVGRNRGAACAMLSMKAALTLGVPAAACSTWTGCSASSRPSAVTQRGVGQAS